MQASLDRMYYLAVLSKELANTKTDETATFQTFICFKVYRSKLFSIYDLLASTKGWGTNRRQESGFVVRLKEAEIIREPKIRNLDKVQGKHYSRWTGTTS